jgi:glycosyltransferase involved in cell wall biosynthesis
VGDGPDREMLERQVRRAKLDATVRFHGRLNHDEVARLLQQADLVVAPSVPSRDGRREGIPVALMEAMAAGVPVVASNLSGIPELVEDNGTGLLVPPGDARALSRAIQRLLLDPPLRCRLALAARDKVVREFDLPTNAALLAQRFTTGVYA